MWTVVEIARHELAVILRTRRALALLTLYLGSALGVGLAYAVVVRFMERGLQSLLSEETGSPVLTERALELLAEPAYRTLLAFLAGAPIDELAPSLQGSPILPFVLWGSLAFLPFLILLTSFDQIAGDLESRAIRYSTLRAARASIVVGKVLGHTLVFLALNALAALLLVALASLLVERVDLVASLPGLARVLALLAPFGLCYVCVSSFCSAALGRPFPALITSFVVVAGLRVLSWARFVPEDAELAFLRPLCWLSPSMYESGFWRAGLAEPAASALAYGVVAAVFLAGSVAALQRRAL